VSFFGIPGARTMGAWKPQEASYSLHRLLVFYRSTLQGPQKKVFDAELVAIAERFCGQDIDFPMQTKLLVLRKPTNESKAM
jgi:hypothetical protein